MHKYTTGVNPRRQIVLNENTGSRTPLWGSANPKKRPKPSKNVPNTLYNHNIAQMGMVVHAPKAKNDRIIDLFWFLTPNRIQADMGRIQRYGTGIWRSEMPIDRLGPGIACMVRIVHVRGVHATHTPAQHTPKCTTKVTCPLSTHNSRTVGRRPVKPYTAG